MRISPRIRISRRAERPVTRRLRSCSSVSATAGPEEQRDDPAVVGRGVVERDLPVLLRRSCEADSSRTVVSKPVALRMASLSSRCGSEACDLPRCQRRGLGGLGARGVRHPEGVGRRIAGRQPSLVSPDSRPRPGPSGRKPQLGRAFYATATSSRTLQVGRRRLVRIGPLERGRAPSPSTGPAAPGRRATSPSPGSRGRSASAGSSRG